MTERLKRAPKSAAILIAALLLGRGVAGLASLRSPAPTEAATAPARTVQSHEPGPPPGTYKILSGNGKIAIPFEMDRGKIRMAARVNGHDCHLSVDNGSLWDQLLFFGSPHVDGLGLSKTGEASIGGTKADLSFPLAVSFKDVEFLGQTAVITRYDPRVPNVWDGLDGQVSAMFFKHFVVRIDFDASRIELIPPESFADLGQGQALPMKTGPFGSRTVTADVVMPNGAATTIDLLVDLGGIHPLYLPLGKHDAITLPPDAVAATLGTGLRTQEGYLGKVNTVRLGKYALADVPTAFTPVAKDAGVYGNTMLGLPLLRRFSVTFDYFHDVMILEPSKSYHDPFPSQRTGMKGTAGDLPEVGRKGNDHE
jgi:hypothetical protein